MPEFFQEPVKPDGVTILLETENSPLEVEPKDPDKNYSVGICDAGSVPIFQQAARETGVNVDIVPVAEKDPATEGKKSSEVELFVRGNLDLSNFWKKVEELEAAAKLD